MLLSHRIQARQRRAVAVLVVALDQREREAVQKPGARCRDAWHSSMKSCICRRRGEGGQATSLPILQRGVRSECRQIAVGLIFPELGSISPNMGRIAEPVSLSDALFSKVQQRVLALIFGQPEKSLYTSEIVRALNSGTGAVERELSRLEHSGLVSVERIGNQKHYRANKNAPIFQELRSLVAKTVGLAEPIKEALEPYADTIKAAFVYGSVAKGTDTARSDIDLMVIGDELNYSDLYTAAQTAEDRLRRKVNAVFLSPRDWQRKVSDKGSIISKIGTSPKIFVLGSEEDL